MERVSIVPTLTCGFPESVELKKHSNISTEGFFDSIKWEQETRTQLEAGRRIIAYNLQEAWSSIRTQLEEWLNKNEISQCKFGLTKGYEERRKRNGVHFQSTEGLVNEYGILSKLFNCLENVLKCAQTDCTGLDENSPDLILFRQICHEATEVIFTFEDDFFDHDKSLFRSLISLGDMVSDLSLYFDALCYPSFFRSFDDADTKFHILSIGCNATSCEVGTALDDERLALQQTCMAGLDKTHPNQLVKIHLMDRFWRGVTPAFAATDPDWIDQGNGVYKNKKYPNVTIQLHDLWVPETNDKSGELLFPYFLNAFQRQIKLNHHVLVLNMYCVSDDDPPFFQIVKQTLLKNQVPRVDNIHLEPKYIPFEEAPYFTINTNVS